MEPKLQRVIKSLTRELEALTARLLAGDISLADWTAEFEQILATHHAAAYLLGRGGELTDPLARNQLALLERYIAEQAEYLSGLKRDIAGGRYGDSPRALGARVDMYARSVQPPYWAGKTIGLPLPAMPGEGTQCLTNCRCRWEITTLDAERGDHDCYWRLGAAEHCQTCNQRAVDWNPIQIRGGVLL